ncbi:MAG TPA: Sbal_3080 family lipoprotein [Burkholderiales bacterium]
MIAKRLALLALPLLSACAIHENVKPVDELASREVCIIVNPALFSDGFLPVYEKALQAKGLTVRELPADGKIEDCPVVSTYTANWGWHWATYLSFTRIRIFSNAHLRGEATYDATHGRYSLKKYVRAADKVDELVDQLFPNGAAAVPLRTSGAPAQ